MTKTIQHTLVVYSDVAAGWMGALVADLVVNKRLGLSPAGDRVQAGASFRHQSVVGVGAMLLAAAVSLGALCRAARADVPQTLSTFLAFGTAFVAAPLIAWATAVAAPTSRGEAAPPGPSRGRDRVQHLRTRLRARGHGLLPGLYGADLLALLLAGCALPRRLQAAWPRRRAIRETLPHDPAGARS